MSLTRARIARTWLLALSIAACTPPTFNATFVPGTEDQPGPGAAEVTGDPSESSEHLSFQVVTGEGNVIDRVWEIRPGRVIQFALTNFPRTGYTIRVQGIACAGDFAIAEGMVTEVTLHFEVGGCSLETTGSRPMGAPPSS